VAKNPQAAKPLSGRKGSIPAGGASMARESCGAVPSAIVCGDPPAFGPVRKPAAKVAGRRSAPLLEYRAAFRFNLRALVDQSPTGALATREESRPLGAFLKGYGVDLPLGRAWDEDADPMDKLRDHLARTDRTGPSRYSDGSFPIVYMGDAPEACLAEVRHHLGRALGETGAAKGRIHCFLLARFTLAGEALDVRRGFPALHHAEDWAPAQSFGRRAAAEGRSGITCRSVRRKGAENLGVLRSGFARAGIRVKVIALRWDGAGVVPV
jgi:hypothetical protein